MRSGLTSVSDFRVLLPHDADGHAFIDLSAVFAGLAALLEVADEFAAVAVKIAGDDGVVFLFDVDWGMMSPLSLAALTMMMRSMRFLRIWRLISSRRWLNSSEVFDSRRRRGRMGWSSVRIFEGDDLAFGDRGDAVAESADGSVAFLAGRVAIAQRQAAKVRRRKRWIMTVARGV